MTYLPLRVVQVPPDSPAYIIEEDIEGGLVVIETATMLIMGLFRQDMRDFAEDMRDRLIIRRLARIADQRRCPVCGRPAIAVRKPLRGPAFWTHEDDTVHLDPLAALERS